MAQITDTLSAMISAVTIDVLETMFFTTAVPVICANAGDGIAARVRFEGSPYGEMRVMLSRQLAESISAGFLAEDATDIDAEKQVACELANIICGALLSRVHPDSRVALFPPEVITSGIGAAPDESMECFETPEGPLSVVLHVQ